jgi:hypothetical protein
MVVFVGGLLLGVFVDAFVGVDVADGGSSVGGGIYPG